jgi:hypothetical protein
MFSCYKKNAPGRSVGCEEGEANIPFELDAHGRISTIVCVALSHGKNRAPYPRAAAPGLLFSLSSPEQLRNQRYASQRAYIELFVRPAVVAVVVVSDEAAHPEIKTAVGASVAKAISLVFVAVNSELARKANGSWPFPRNT